MQPNNLPKHGQLAPVTPNIIGPNVGLNDDFLLDSTLEAPEPTIHVKAFQDSAPGELPTEDPNTDLIAAAECECSKLQADTDAALEELEVNLRDLELLRHRIRDEKGMSASIALECNDVMPGFLNEENRPVQFFTQHNTKTLLKEALEAIEEGENKAKGNFMDKIREMAEKFFAWISDKYEKLQAFFAKTFSKAGKEKYEADPVDQEKAKALALANNPTPKDPIDPNDQARPVADTTVADFTQLAAKYNGIAAKSFTKEIITEHIVKQANSKKAFPDHNGPADNSGPIKEAAAWVNSDFKILRDLQATIESIDTKRWEYYDENNQKLEAFEKESDAEFANFDVNAAAGILYDAFFPNNEAIDKVRELSRSITELIKQKVTELKSVNTYQNPSELHGAVKMISLFGRVSGIAYGAVLECAKGKKAVDSACSSSFFQMEKSLEEDLKAAGFDQRSGSLAEKFMRNLFPNSGPAVRRPH